VFGAARIATARAVKAATSARSHSQAAAFGCTLTTILKSQCPDLFPDPIDHTLRVVFEDSDYLFLLYRKSLYTDF
jgi:hypothetical protein